MPKTKLGKWSAWLNIAFLLVIATAIVLVLGFGTLSFDDHWWDITVPIAFVIEMIALFTGIQAIRKNQERSYMVYFSVFMGICTILFVLLHSLFISD